MQVANVTMHRDKNATSHDVDVGQRKLLVRSMFFTLQGEGPYAGQPALFLRLGGCNLGAKGPAGCSGCFPATHKIKTPKGKVTFDSVDVGDSLYALDHDGNVCMTTVMQKHVRSADPSTLIDLVIDVDGSLKHLRCTEEHPIHTSNRGFVRADELTSKDRIVHIQQYDLSAFRMRSANPMFAAACVEQQQATVRKKKAEGHYRPTVLSEEARNKIRQSKLGKRNPMKRHSVRLASMLGHTYPMSKLEKAFVKIFEHLRIKHTYCGNDASTVIGNEVLGYRRPDFFLGKNKVVEVYDPTHNYKFGSKLKKRTIRNYETPTRAFYEAFGYEVLFLKPMDRPNKGVGSGNVADASAWAAFKERIIAFKRNGARLVKASRLTNAQRGQLDLNEGQVDVVNFTCHPYNTFLVNSIHTHNCDTDFRIEKSTPMSFEEIEQKLLDLVPDSPLYPNKYRVLLVITGGEPSLHTQLPEFLNHTTFLDMQIESNGHTVATLDKCQSFYGAYVVFSPKASAKGYAPALIPVHTDTVALQIQGRFFDPDFTCYKFVVSADPVNMHHKLPEWVTDPDRPDVVIYVSPCTEYLRSYEGEVSSAWDHTLVDAERTQANYAYAAQLAMQYNLRLSIQTHTLTAIP